MFTSSESIMRNNPSNPSSVEHDPFDKLERGQKQPEPPLPTSRFSDMSMGGKLHPSTPGTMPKAMPDSPILPQVPSRAVARARQSSLAYIMPVLGLSERKFRSAGPDGIHGVYPRTPLPVANIGNAI